MTFLQLVAKDLVKKFPDNLNRLTVVFPNKRASLFMNDALLAEAGHTIWSPRYTTISQLFRSQSQKNVADEIKLVCLLHRSFCKCTGSEEGLDQFYGWGRMLLSDFDDIDKNLADPAKVLKNITDLHEFDTVDYLTDEQKMLLKQFFKNFTDDHESLLRRRFQVLWSNLYNIYTDFNRSLSEEGIAYEGALYRSVVENGLIEGDSVYAFVGFNVVQKAERRLFSILKNEGRALFYWDFPPFFSTEAGREAGASIQNCLAEFPNEIHFPPTDAMELRNGGDTTSSALLCRDISIMSSATETAQARYVSQWLAERNRVDDGTRTAIVMCDEKLLPVVMNSVPPQASPANITTGFPLQQTPAASLFNVLWQMQTVGRNADGSYVAKHVAAVARHPYMKMLSADIEALCARLSANRFYILRGDEIATDDNTRALFTAETPAKSTETMLSWLETVVKMAAVGNRVANGSALTADSLFALFTLLQRIHTLIGEGVLTTDQTTLYKLVSQLISTASIPFHGEPASGIQIMGVLETRNLDFEHVLILSCSEGNMPRGTSEASLIPHSLRKAYNLTTTQHKTGIYAYYFYRLLCRAGDVTILYNSSASGTRGGEPSRFVTQLKAAFPDNVKLLSLSAENHSMKTAPLAVEKDEAVMERLLSIKKFYPTLLNMYLRCQLKFYHAVVENLREPQPDDDSDPRVFGNVFHLAAKKLYEPFCGKECLTQHDIDGILGNHSMINSAVDEALAHELRLPKGANVPRSGLTAIQHRVIVAYLARMFRIDKQLAARPMSIIALEHEVMMPVKFVPNGMDEEVSITVGGIIDRLDCVTLPDGGRQIRIVDYKTGRKPNKHPKEIGQLFSEEGHAADIHADYYLQTMLYSMAVSNDDTISGGMVVAPALFFVKTANSDTSPILLMDKTEISDIRDYAKEMSESLNKLFSDIYNPTKAFIPTADKKQCETCPFSRICR